MIDHLRGREKALEAFGWTGRRAEWIALACLHGGVFTRAQWTSFLGCHHEHVRRAVHAVVAQGAAIEENPPGIAGIGRVCRIRSAGAFPDRASALRLITAVALRTTAVWSERRYLDLSLLEPKEVAKAA